MKYIIAPIILSFLFASCGQKSPENKEVITNNQEEKTVDKHSYSIPSEIRTTHLHLNLAVDFETEVITGSVIHSVDNLTGTDEFIVDANELAISKVLLDNGEETNFELGTFDEITGQSLKIKVSPETKEVTIFYETAPSSKALQWLSSQQTAGKEHPFLFTQGEAILTRTWIPCQDTPGNRITYSADISIPNNLMAVMSADNASEKSIDGNYHFKMDKPIPTYLIALAVGDIEFQSLGDRTGVYAEPSMLAKSAYEFEEVEEMIIAAESLYGEYQWGRYDIIVLPPSFPYGGMENPKLTFATPTILAGDRSLVSLIAHELAHSWSGNLVTNATWDDFWLNEGFTVYFENRIMEKIYGKEYADMLFSIEYDELLIETESILASEYPEDTKLKLDLEGRDPDDGMSAIAYVKGALFLMTLENAVGREKFDVFIHDYFKNHEFQTITTEAFVAYLNQELIQPNNITFNVDEWIYEVRIPTNAIEITSNRFDSVALKSAMIPEMQSVAELNIDEEAWSTQEWMHFIRKIPAETPVEKFELLDAAYNFSDGGNSEIMSEWYIMSIRHGYDKINPYMRKFLIEVGRRKFLEPIYTALVNTPEGKEMALDIYAQARPNYHSISIGTIDEILSWQN